MRPRLWKRLFPITQGYVCATCRQKSSLAWERALNTSRQVKDHKGKSGDIEAPKDQGVPRLFRKEESGPAFEYDDAEFGDEDPHPVTRVSQKPIQIPPSALSLHVSTRAPTEQDTALATDFFLHPPPKFLSSSPRFLNLPQTAVPEVAFLGRSNVGKSSLLNALFGQKDMARVSKRPGRTREMNQFGIGVRGDAQPGDVTKGAKMVLLDMPGYGKGSQANWGVEIIKYLKGRKQ
jgi:50S ribosome-binding GTPase